MGFANPGEIGTPCALVGVVGQTDLVRLAAGFLWVVGPVGGGHPVQIPRQARAVAVGIEEIERTCVGQSDFEIKTGNLIVIESIDSKW